MAATSLGITVTRSQERRGDRNMYRKNHRRISFLLASLMIIAAVLLHGGRAEAAIACADTGMEGCTVMSRGAVTGDFPLCTAEMLGAQSKTGRYQPVVRSISPRGEVRADIPALSFDAFSCMMGIHFGNPETIHLTYHFSKELIISFIHKSDGKKRI